MYMIIRVLLVLTGSLSAMNGFSKNVNLDLDLLHDKGIIIINTKKTKKEPSFAFLKRSDGPCLKIYNGIFEENNFFKQIIKNVNSLEIDHCEIKKISEINGIRTLMVTHCRVTDDINITFKGSLVNVNISYNTLNKKIYERLLKIEKEGKEGTIIIKNNVIMEDNLNN